MATGTAHGAADGQKPQSAILTPVPNHAKVNEGILLKGDGFGAKEGGISFGSASASVVSWSEKEVKVKVPDGLAGRTAITLTPQGGSPIATAPDAFLIGCLMPATRPAARFSKTVVLRVAVQLRTYKSRSSCFKASLDPGRAKPR